MKQRAKWYSVGGVVLTGTLLLAIFSPAMLWVLGGLTMVILFSARDILSQYIAGLILRWEKPFQLGDHLFAEEFSGEVTRITFRSTRMRDWAGLEVTIPNSNFFKHKFANLTKRRLGGGQLDVPVYLPLALSIASAYELLEKAIDEGAHDAKILFCGQGDRVLHFVVRFPAEAKVEPFLKSMEDHVRTALKPDCSGEDERAT